MRGLRGIFVSHFASTYDCNWCVKYYHSSTAQQIRQSQCKDRISDGCGHIWIYFYSLSFLLLCEDERGSDYSGKDVYKRQTYTYQGKIAGSFVSAGTYLVIPEGVYRSMNPRGTAYGYLWVDCDKKDEASVEQSLNTLISNTSHIKMDTYHAQLQSAEFASSMMKLGCYLFMAIVGLFGFMNMANTMIMNITTKKQEYGVLQAVGMTNKQLNLCLQLQGLIFTVGTICVALIIGLPLGYALFSYAKHNGIFGMNIYHVPIVPIFIMIFLVGLLQIVLSCVLSSNLKKETLVERIRYQG